MTEHDPASIPLSAPPTGPPPPTTPVEPNVHSRERPWWGIGDVLLGVPFVLLISGLVTVPFIIWTVVGNNGEIDVSASTSLPVIGVGAGLLAQQLATGVWPVWIAQWQRMLPRLT